MGQQWPPVSTPQATSPQAGAHLSHTCGWLSKAASRGGGTTAPGEQSCHGCPHAVCQPFLRSLLAPTASLDSVPGSTAGRLPATQDPALHSGDDSLCFDKASVQ